MQELRKVYETGVPTVGKAHVSKKPVMVIVQTPSGDEMFPLAKLYQLRALERLNVEIHMDSWEGQRELF